MKKLILVTSPPACGKTFISKQLAKALNHVVYLDKDTLIPLSKQIFAVAHQPYDRSSIFFEKYIRDLEYRVVLDLAMEALEYDDIVLINAPFTQEIRDLDYITTLRAELKKKQAELAKQKEGSKGYQQAMADLEALQAAHQEYSEQL